MNTRGWHRLVLVGITMALLAGCQDSSWAGITVSEAWVRPSAMTSQTSAAYMVIENGAAAADELLSVTSDVAATIELHESQEVAGMMEMAPVDGITVPAGGRVTLEPGGLHVMLIGLTQALELGTEVELVLHFAEAGDVPVMAEVREP